MSHISFLLFLFYFSSLLSSSHNRALFLSPYTSFQLVSSTFEVVRWHDQKKRENCVFELLFFYSPVAQYTCNANNESYWYTPHRIPLTQSKFFFFFFFFSFIQYYFFFHDSFKRALNLIWRKKNLVVYFRVKN